MSAYPVIGVSGSVNAKETEHFLLRSYFSAIIDAGAIPLMLSPDMDDDMIDVCLKRLDGLFLAGGNDIAPECFGAQPVEELGEVNPLRDQLEMKLIPRAFAMKMPVLGICRGVQIMNVAMGGTLWQDLPRQCGTEDAVHYPCHNDWSVSEAHSISVVPESQLAKIAGEGSYSVNSFHHQAVKTVPEGMIVSAKSPDGVIEAIESAEGPLFLGVQWHPERLHTTDPHARALFEALVEAAR